MVDEEENEKGKITPEKAYKILRSEGLDVTLEQAGKILEFLKKLATITVASYLRRKKMRK